MAENKNPHIPQQEKREERLVRILSKDIEGKMKVYPGLTKIKGVSWTFSNAVCKTLKIDKNKTIGTLTEQEIQKISDFIKNPQLPNYIFNRRKDIETGNEKHLTGTDLDLRKDFDIKKLKKIKSYRGLRQLQDYLQEVKEQKLTSEAIERKVLELKRRTQKELKQKALQE